MENHQIKIAIFGPGPAFKGGIAHFSMSLAAAFSELANTQVYFFSWKNQYPSIIPRDFKDKTSKDNPLDQHHIRPAYLLDFNNPLSWKYTALKIAEVKPNLLIVQWAIAIQGLPLSAMLKRFKKLMPDCQIIFDVHNVVQKENSRIDRYFTRKAFALANKFIVHGDLTVTEFQSFFPDWEVKVGSEGFNYTEPTRQILKLYHPNYELFDGYQEFDVTEFKNKLGLKGFVFLFFGFIRPYKGLHHVLRAFAEFSKKYPDCTLLIAGESFWAKAQSGSWPQKLQNFVFGFIKRLLMGKGNNDADYQPLKLVAELGIEDRVVTVNTFIPNEAVHQYFKASDAVLNFYEYATPSGIESIAYQFGVQIVATPVGHFRYAIKSGINGYLSEGFETAQLLKAMEAACHQPIAKEKVKDYACQFSWKNYVSAILNGWNK
ncbi:MAG: glycosyltransferase [Flavobacteriales bacterium]